MYVSRVFSHFGTLLWLISGHCRGETLLSANSNLTTIYASHLTNIPNAVEYSGLRGGVNWDTCCRLAINESLYVVGDTLQIRPGQTYYRGDIATLEAFPQFPCTATFNGSLTGPPQDFWTPYPWCHEHCPGWSITATDNYDNWMKPLVVFILPSLIFCLSIPRRRRLELPRFLFEPRSRGGVERALSLLVRVPLASLLATLDTLIWLAAVFSVAGPLIASGAYEALLDVRILAFLEKRIDGNSLTVRERAHLLLIVLIGNLDHDPAWDHSKQLVNGLPNGSLLSRYTFSVASIRAQSPQSSNSPNPPVVEDEERGENRPTSPSLRNSDSYPGRTDHQIAIDEIKTKVGGMLESQPSFGTTVGAPIFFYVGSFLYSVFEVHGNLGSCLTAHHLAFGMFWMTIPHIALTSSLLLAGNNPSVLGTAIPSHQPRSHSNRGSEHPNSTKIEASQRKKTWAYPGLLKNAKAPFFNHFIKNPYQAAYDHSRYKPAWLWNRGCSKAMWVARLAEEYEFMQPLQAEVLGRRFGDYTWRSGFIGVALIFVPCFLGGLVSYTTPQVGLSCRSLTILVYGLSQIVLIQLCLLNWCFWKRDRSGAVRSFSKARPPLLTWVDYVWYTVFFFNATLGLVSSIGGTIFILLGVYRNCLCVIHVTYWWDRMTNPNAVMFWNNATAEQLYYAKTFWLPAGITSTAFMAVTALIGWWYQRRLRVRFHALVEKIDYINQQNLRELERIDVDERV